MKIAKTVIAAAMPRRINVYRDDAGIYKILVPGHAWTDKHGVIIRQSSSGAVAAIRQFPVVSA